MPEEPRKSIPVPQAGGIRMQERRLRIAFVYRYFNRSGSIASTYVDRAERLARDEDVTLFCSDEGRAETEAPVQFETVNPLVRSRSRFGYALECGSFALRAARRLERERERFDLVHVDGYASLRADIVTVHGVRPAEVEHYFSRVEPSALLRRRLTPVFRPQTGVVLQIERQLFRPPIPLCIAISKGIATELQHHYGLPAELIEVIPTGVDTELFQPDPVAREEVRRRVGVSPEQLVILFVGDEFARKGLDRAIVGIARAAQDAELWVVGGGDDRAARATAAALGVGDRVRFLGRLPNLQLPGIYAAADALLLPSLQDVWGNSVVEAMACGRTVLVSEFTGAHEIVTHGKNGFVLAGRGEPEEIAEIVDAHLASAELRESMGLAALEATRPYGKEQLHERFRAVHHRAHQRRLQLAGTGTRSEQRARRLGRGRRGAYSWRP